jgi:ATP-dependent Lhr-like helicase
MAASPAYELLDSRLQRWIHKQGWPTLREVQEKAIGPILGADRDVIIAAPTAGGKTEAAFLPICSKLASQSPAGGFRALCVIPLKALINDQFRRLEDLCAAAELTVHRWHGDVGHTAKRRVREHPSGVLLITPESLESIFVNHGTAAPGMFGGLEFVVVDELHAFLGTERGRHLQSLLHRVERLQTRAVPRVALSATLGDMKGAARFLRHDGKLAYEIVRPEDASSGLKLRLHGYVAVTSGDDESGGPPERHVEQIARHIFNNLRGHSNLVFTNRRTDTEQYADVLRQMSERENVPNEFWPHHGSLSRQLREQVEDRLQDTRPATAVCTTTLELGIDVGAVSSIAQIGNPPSVAGLRQRLGRSGRRGGPAILRIYIGEEELTQRHHPEDSLRLELVQSVAVVNLLLERWYEPPRPGELHLSTLIHQTLSLIAEKGGVRAIAAYQILCGQGPFRGVTEGDFVEVLRSMGSAELLSETHDGVLVLGPAGERIVNHYDFYAVFWSPAEYRLLHEGKVLGTLPVRFPLVAETFLIFAGRRWEVVRVDAEKRTVDLRPAKGGKVPRFFGDGGSVHDRVREEMRNVYLSEDVPTFLDAQARSLLSEGRENFRRLDLARRSLVEWGREVVFFPWRGDRVLNTVTRLLASEGMRVSRGSVSITLAGQTAASAMAVLRRLSEGEQWDPVELADTVANKETNKFDCYLPPNLLARDYAVREFDMTGALESIRRALSVSPPLVA